VSKKAFEMETPASQVWILVLTVEEEVHRVVEQLERFWEASLSRPKRRLQVQKDGLVAERILGALGPRLPPGIRHVEAPLGSREIALHPESVPEGGPGEAAELIDPELLEQAAFRDPVRQMDGEIGEMEGLGRLLRRGLAAPADEQLAEAPAHEALVGMETRESLLRIEGQELLQKPGRLGAGAGKGRVNWAEESGKGVGLVKLKQPAADLSAKRADGEQVEELLVLLRRPVHGEQVLQGGGIEMFVLHAASPPLKASWTERDNSVTWRKGLFVIGKNGPGAGARPARSISRWAQARRRCRRSWPRWDRSRRRERRG
jgi:hypothetical protein